MMILIAGPYRSGTNDNPALIRKNVELMESYALPLFRAGHIPILGEWLALPLVQLAGSKHIGDEAFNEIFHPISVRLLRKCDAVLRIGGPSGYFVLIALTLAGSLAALALITRPMPTSEPRAKPAPAV